MKAKLSFAILALLAVTGYADAQNTMTIQGNLNVENKLSVGGRPMAVPVLSSCDNYTSTCTAFAVCPTGMTITSGWWFSLLPDSRPPAYGICGTKSGACKFGDSSCLAYTAVDQNGGKCVSPAYDKQTLIVSIVCQ